MIATVTQQHSTMVLWHHTLLNTTLTGRALPTAPRGSWAPTPLYYHEGGRGRALLDPLLSQGGIFGSLGYWAAGLRCMGYLCCPCVPSERVHLFWRNHQPTTLIFNKDPPPSSSSQHDRRRRRQSRQHSFSSSPGRAVCCRRRRRKKEGGEEEEKKYTVCTQCLLLHDVQYLSI